MPPSESHDEFLELCALAASGSLSNPERTRLARHLSGCRDCRAMMAQYEALIGKVIPALASEISSDDLAVTASDWSPEQAEAALFRKLDAHPQLSQNSGAEGAEASPFDTLRPKKAPPANDRLWRHLWWQFAAGLLLLAALGFSIYRVGIQRGIESAQLASPALPPVPSVPVPRSSEVESTLHPGAGDAEQKNDQVAALQAQLRLRSEEIARLTAQQAQLEKDLAARETERTRVAQEKTDLSQKLEVAQTNLQSIQQNLDAVTAQAPVDAAQIAELRERVNDLTSSMHEKDRELAREQDLLDHDRDIRELMGSRHLYMAEVYDYAKTGTQKPFGRVFYTQGKSLVFYAYDLDQQPGIKNASTFQAWGRRGPDNERAINLGIFYQDNADKKRWILKSTNPKTLAQIDAVFVTVEPSGGSPHPSTNPFLWAYLRIEPNHP